MTTRPALFTALCSYDISIGIQLYVPKKLVPVCSEQQRVEYRLHECCYSGYIACMQLCHRQMPHANITVSLVCTLTIVCSDLVGGPYTPIAAPTNPYTCAAEPNGPAVHSYQDARPPVMWNDPPILKQKKV